MGAVKATVSFAFPAVIPSMTGAVGAPGIRAAALEDQVPTVGLLSISPVKAATWNKYSVPFVKPETVSVRGAESPLKSVPKTVQFEPPSEE